MLRASLIALGTFVRHVRAVSGRDEILALTLTHFRSLVPIEKAAFYVPKPKSAEFELQCPLAPGDVEQLMVLIDEAIDSGIFGWALNRHRPAIFRAANGKDTLMLAALRTRNRLMGMFVALLGPDASAESLAGSPALSPHMAFVADALLTEELTVALQVHNRHLNSLVEERTRQLQEMLEQRQRFMRVAAHDLRNLLTIINAYSSHALGQNNPDMKQMALSRTHSVCANMRGLIDDFLDLKVLETSKDGSQVLFDLKTLVAQVVENGDFAAKSKGIVLKSFSPEGTCLARGNVGHTHQILTNYISNAVKFSPRGKEVHVALFLRARCWRIEVLDQGPGVAPEERERLFTEFAKISNKPTGNETSTGLGLSIVKALAEGQGGKVGAEFPEIGGSKFWVEVPAYV